MEERHPLFDELDAWNPRWQHKCANLRDCSRLAGLLVIYDDFLRTPEGKKYLQSMRDVPDTLADIRAQQEMAASSALPYSLSNIGRVPNVED